MEKQIPADAQNAIGLFSKSLKKILADKFDDIILFGFYARGDEEFGSDIDLLLILNEKMTEMEKSEINEILSKVSLKHDLVVSCFPYEKDDYKSKNTPFLLNVKKEGIAV
jgi:predicted nucleotidyltransferase